MRESIESLGTTLVPVYSSRARGPGGVASSSDAELTMDDGNAIVRNARSVAAVSWHDPDNQVLVPARRRHADRDETLVAHQPAAGKVV